MNRKAEIFFDAVTLLREDLVEEAQNVVFRKQGHGWKKIGSLAACAALVVSLGMLAALPRGCGANGSNMVSTDMNTSGAPASPAEMPPDASEDPPYGAGSMSGANKDTATRPPEGEYVPDMGPGDGLVQFNAQVLEVLDDGLLVEPLDGLPANLGRVRIPTAELEDLPEFRPGDVAGVFCGGIAQEDGAAVAEDVTALWLVEPD